MQDNQIAQELKSNVFDTALIFEGGGMRESYSSAIANAFLDAGIYFDHVYGVSAGSSSTVNYISRDTRRTKASFTSLTRDPEFGGMHTFLQGKGLFNSEHIYAEISQGNGGLPFNMNVFLANPAKATIAAFVRDTGATMYFTKDSMGTLDDLMLRVRASSTLPIAMPSPIVDGVHFYDGGLGEGNGLLIEQAKRDGFEKFFVVRTRPRAYRKPEKPSPFVRNHYWKYPHMQHALDVWGLNYNRTCDEIESLEAKGAACVAYAEDMLAKNNTKDLAVLEANYANGASLAQRSMAQWIKFLGL